MVYGNIHIMTSSSDAIANQILAGSGALPSVEAAETHHGMARASGHDLVVPDFADAVRQASADIAQAADDKVAETMQRGKAGALCLQALGLAIDICANAAEEQPGGMVFTPGQTSLKSLVSKQHRITHSSGPFQGQHIWANDRPGVLLPSVDTDSGPVQPELILTAGIHAERPFSRTYRRSYQDRTGDVGFGPAGDMLPGRWGIRRISVGAHVEITPVAADNPVRVPGSEIGVSLAFSDSGYFLLNASHTEPTGPFDPYDDIGLDMERYEAQLDQLQTFIGGYAHRPGTAAVTQYAEQKRWQ